MVIEPPAWVRTFDLASCWTRPTSRIRSGRPAALVFSGNGGRPLRRTRFSDVWRPATTAAGLGHAVTFHDLRHDDASVLIRVGDSVKTVQRRLGHQSAVETLDSYSHLWPDSEDRTREAVAQ